MAAKDLKVVDQPAEAPLAHTSEEDELAAFLRENKGDGLSRVPDKDIILPRLAICQPSTPGSGEGGLLNGHIFNTVTQHNYKGEMSFILLHLYPSRVRWESPDPGSDIDCTSSDYEHGTQKDAEHAYGICAKCPHAQFQGKERPTCSEFRNLVGIPWGEEPQPFLQSGARSALKPIRQLISAMAGKPAYSYRIKMTTVKNMKDGKTWYTPKYDLMYNLADGAARKAAGDEVTTSQILAELRTYKTLSDQIKESQDRILLNVEQEPTATAEEGAF